MYGLYLYFSQAFEITDADECDPVIFTLSVDNIEQTDDSDEDYIPECRYFNTTTNSWETNGCTLVDYHNNTATCSCTHLTTFSVFVKGFVPSPRIVKYDDIEGITLEQVMICFLFVQFDIVKNLKTNIFFYAKMYL